MEKHTFFFLKWERFMRLFKIKTEKAKGHKRNMKHSESYFKKNVYIKIGESDDEYLTRPFVTKKFIQ